MRRLSVSFWILLLCVTFLVSGTPVLGDTVYLKSGRKVVGRIVSESKTEVVVERGSIRGAIQRKDIESIEYDSDKRGSEEGRKNTKKLIEEGEELYRAGRYGEAARVFERLKSAGESSARVERMAKLCGALSRASNALRNKMLKEARDAANEALAADKENAPAKKVLEEVARYDKQLAESGSLPGKFLLRRTKHFLIYHHEPYLASEVAASARKDIAYLLKALLYDGCHRPALKDKFKITIYRDADEYKEATGSLGQLFHSMTTSKTEIATYQKVALKNLRHEITHLLIHIILPSMPVWVHEGLATGGYERARSSTYSSANAYLSAGKFLPFDDFLKIRTPDKMSMSIGAFYMQSRMAVEFLIFGKKGMEKFHRFAKRSREIMVRDVNAWAKTQKKKKVTVRNIDWIEKPMREMLAEIYGYADLKDFDADLKAYIKHREKEAGYQERQQVRKLDADWKCTLRLDSEHFALFTTCDKSVAAPLLALAERLYEAFWLEFADAKIIIPGKVKIYVFNKVREYVTYLNAHGHNIDPKVRLVNPHFNPFSGAACVCRENVSRDFLYQSTAHEITHGLSVSVMNSFFKSGCWVVEGIAHYVGMSTYSKTDKIAFEKIHQTKYSAHVGFLKLMMKQKRVRPLREFINMGYNGFRKDFTASNVQCWTLFHFLQHAEDGKYRDGFHKYLAGICAGGKGDAAAFEKCVGELSEVEPAYLKYLKTLKASTKTR